MAPTATLTQETICALDGRPVDKASAAFIKAIDKLLTVGAYYSTDHAQYHTASEEVCQQVVAAIGRSPSVAVEITAKGMMIRSQLIDPQHRNVRLLHDLLVPLNIARLEFRASLTPADLRRAIEVLQERRLQLGSGSGFREIVIDGLPDSVCTAGRNVVQGERDGGLTLEELLAPFAAADPNPAPCESTTEGERLARQFLDIVASILANLERTVRDQGAHPEGAVFDATPERIRALRESLRRLAEINPDPKDLARLIEDAKRALDLSRDPDSVDLVFSLLKKEANRGERWREQGASKAKHNEYMGTVEDLLRQTEELAAVDDPVSDPRVTSVTDHLGICFHLLEIEPSSSVENAIIQALDEILSRPRVAEEVLACCFSAMGTAAARDPVETIDRLFPAFCEPLRRSRPRDLARFWTKLWKFLPADRHAVVWPHFLNDLMNGLGGLPRGIVAGLWRTAGSVSPETALRAVPRLELLSAWVAGRMPTSLLNIPPRSVFPVYLAIMKSRLAPAGGPRLHHQLGREAKSPLASTLLRATGDYDPKRDGLYLALARQGDSSRLSDRTRKLAFRTLHEVLGDLDPALRGEDWVVDAIRWAGRLDPEEAAALMVRIGGERKWFFFRAWPAAPRLAAADVLARIERREAPGKVR
jgi:hypothetical protein